MNYIEIAKEVIETEADELHKFAKSINESFHEAIELILETTGKVIIIGVGKSGLIGTKIAATLSSTGTSSFFVHPTEAMHGDLGMLSPNDVTILISYSGESEEVVAIAPHIRRLGNPIIVMASNPNSSLAKLSDIFLSIKIENEACPLDTAPTSSTTATLALGDAIAVTLMRARGFKKDDFASFHPGGSLGKKLFVKVSQFVQYDNLPIVTQSTPLKEAIVVMSAGRLGSVMIVDEHQELLAILSDGDLRRALLDETFNLHEKALKYATKNPSTLEDDTILASDALKIIEDKKIQLLIFTTNKKIKGVVHIHTLIEAGIQ